MGDHVSSVCPLSERLENELPKIVIEVLKRSVIFLFIFELIFSVGLEGVFL